MRVFSLSACPGVTGLRSARSGLAWGVRLAAVAAVVLAGVPGLARAGGEVRTFSVAIDGKPGGTHTITTDAADGAETITVVSDVKVKTLLYTYTYQLNSVEIWKDGRLVALEARSNDDGKRRAVSALARDGALSVTVDRVTRRVAADVVTATGVRVPAADKARDGVLFDAEDGSEKAVRFEPLGACRVTLNGSAIEGTRYRLTGKGVDGEWWFDKNGRVIRQDVKWDGHRVVLELTGVR